MTDALFPAEDVDTTARYVSHPTWKLFGDELLTPVDESDRLAQLDTETSGE